jgi:hypothetical protein
MRVIPSLQAKGFIGRSIDEFKRLSVIGISTKPSCRKLSLTLVVQL